MRLRFEAKMLPLFSTDSMKSFAMPPAADHRHRFLPTTRALLTSLSFLRPRIRLLILLFFPSLFLLLLSSTYSGDRNSFLIHFLHVLIVFSSVGLVLLLLCSFSVHPPTFSIPLYIRALYSWIRADRRTGLGVKPYDNGDIYEGDLRRGKCWGRGVYYCYYKSGKYEGDWIDSKWDGHGVETLNNGSRYVGEFKKGLRHGFGVYRCCSGDLYAGEWLNGQMHGYADHISGDGNGYVGEFKRGLKHGLGHHVNFRNGESYAGEYFADKMHGFGVYHFAGGDCYEGAWRYGKREGLGMCIFANGDSQSGHWANNVLDVSTSTNSFPGASFAVNHTRVLDAVQDARTMAKRAYNVPRVYYKVLKAVDVANKAANAARVAGSKAVQLEKRDHGVEYLHDFPMQIV